MKSYSNFSILIQGKFMCYTGAGSVRVPDLTKILQYGNSIVGHAFLIDRNSFIRWRAVGSPAEKEIEALINCTKQLLLC